MWKETKEFGDTVYEWERGKIGSENSLLLVVQKARFSYDGTRRSETNSAFLHFILPVHHQDLPSYDVRQTIGLNCLPENFSDTRISLENVLAALTMCKTETEKAEGLLPETGYRSSELKARGSMLRERMDEYARLVKTFSDVQESITLGSSQRIFPKGYVHVSDPHRDLEPRERALIKPSLVALLEALPDLQPPYMPREKYVQVLNERF